MGRKREYFRRIFITKEQIRQFLDKLEVVEDEELEILGRKLLESYNRIFALKNMLKSDNERLKPYEDMYHKELEKNKDIEKKVNKTINENKTLVKENAKLKIEIDELQQK